MPPRTRRHATPRPAPVVHQDLYTESALHERPDKGTGRRRKPVIADAGASIKDIAHDRAFSGPDVSAVHAVCTVETRDRAHIAALRRALKQNGFPLVVEQ